MFSFLWSEPAVDGQASHDDDIGAVAGDGEPVPAAAAAEVHAAAAPAAAARAAGRGQPGSDRLLRSKTALRKEADAQAIDDLSALSNPSLQTEVSKEFAFNAGKMGRKDNELVTLTCDPSHHAVVDRNRTHQRRRWRALSSHVGAVCDRLPTLVEGARVVLLNEVIDDATMWTRLPPDKKDVANSARKKRAAAAAGKKTKPHSEKQSAAGRNVATPVMTMVQHVITQRDGQAPRSTQIHVPCQAVPQSNWSTLNARKKRWSVWTGSDVGDVF